MRHHSYLFLSRGTSLMVQNLCCRRNRHRSMVRSNGGWCDENANHVFMKRKKVLGSLLAMCDICRHYCKYFLYYTLQYPPNYAYWFEKHKVEMKSTINNLNYIGKKTPFIVLYFNCIIPSILATQLEVHNLSVCKYALLYKPLLKIFNGH